MASHPCPQHFEVAMLIAITFISDVFHFDLSCVHNTVGLIGAARTNSVFNYGDVDVTVCPTLQIVPPVDMPLLTTGF